MPQTDKHQLIVIDSRNWTGDYEADGRRKVARQNALQKARRVNPIVAGAGMIAFGWIFAFMPPGRRPILPEWLGFSLRVMLAVALTLVGGAIVAKALRRGRG